MLLLSNSYRSRILALGIPVYVSFLWPTRGHVRVHDPQSYLMTPKQTRVPLLQLVDITAVLQHEYLGPLVYDTDSSTCAA